ncbi:MAG: LITAF-like zinc ribbon domain-containing protein [Acidobacteriota bacterium]
MIKCQNCGNINTTESNFCRFCGTRFLLEPPAPQRSRTEPQPFDHAPPRPYSWQTDEFSTQNDARKTIDGTVKLAPSGRTSPFAPNQPQPLAFRPGQQVNQPYRCPHCMSQFLPRVERRISTGGWITFAILLVFFFPLFWIGLLVKEEVRVCPSCGNRVG